MPITFIQHNVETEVLATAIRQDRDIKGIQIRKEKNKTVTVCT